MFRASAKRYHHGGLQVEEPRGGKHCGCRPAAPQVLNAFRRQRQGMKRQSRRPGPSLLTTCALPAKRTGRADADVILMWDRCDTEVILI